MTIEKQLEARLKKQITAMGGKCIKMTPQGENAFPDRLILMPGGKTYLAELKSGKKGVISPMQNVRIRQLRLLGYEARIISNREALDSFLDLIEKQTTELNP